MVLFQRGSNFLRGVPNANFYKKNPIQLMIFQWGWGGGVWTPIPPLDPRMHNNLSSSCSSFLKRQKIATDNICLFCCLDNLNSMRTVCLQMIHICKCTCLISLKFRKIIIQFQNLYRELCVRVRPFYFIFLWFSR